MRHKQVRIFYQDGWVVVVSLVGCCFGFLLACVSDHATASVGGAEMVVADLLACLRYGLRCTRGATLDGLWLIAMQDWRWLELRRPTWLGLECRALR